MVSVMKSRNSIVNYKIDTKKLALILLTFCLASCGGRGNNSGEDTNSILGTWKHVYPSTQCIELNTFTADGEFTGTALDEIYSGNYTFDGTPADGERYKLTLEITSDNEQADCNGSNTSSVGKSIVVYVSFPSEDAVEYYTENVGGDFIIDFTRAE